MDDEVTITMLNGMFPPIVGVIGHGLNEQFVNIGRVGRARQRNFFAVLPEDCVGIQLRHECRRAALRDGDLRRLAGTRSAC